MLVALVVGMSLIAPVVCIILLRDLLEAQRRAMEAIVKVVATAQQESRHVINNLLVAERGVHPHIVDPGTFAPSGLAWSAPAKEAEAEAAVVDMDEQEEARRKEHDRRVADRLTGSNLEQEYNAAIAEALAAQKRPMTSP